MTAINCRWYYIIGSKCVQRKSTIVQSISNFFYFIINQYIFECLKSSFCISYDLISFSFKETFHKIEKTYSQKGQKNEYTQTSFIWVYHLFKYLYQKYTLPHTTLFSFFLSRLFAKLFQSLFEWFYLGHIWNGPLSLSKLQEAVLYRRWIETSLHTSAKQEMVEICS